MRTKDIEFLGETKEVSRFNVREYIDMVEDHVESLGNWFIASYTGFLEFKIKTEKFHNKRLFGLGRFMKEMSGLDLSQEGVWMGSVLEKLCEEDVEWTKSRNEDLRYVAYRKFRLKDEAKRKIEDSLRETLSELYEYSRCVEEEKERKAKEREEILKSYSVAETYKLIHPRGGEDGQDGFFDGDIENNETGEVVRFIAKNIFDFGFVCFPIRLGGSDDIFDLDKWTENELAIKMWFSESDVLDSNLRM